MAAGLGSYGPQQGSIPSEDFAGASGGGVPYYSPTGNDSDYFPATAGQSTQLPELDVGATGSSFDGSYGPQQDQSSMTALTPEQTNAAIAQLGGGGTGSEYPSGVPGGLGPDYFNGGGSDTNSTPQGFDGSYGPQLDNTPQAGGLPGALGGSGSYRSARTRLCR